MGKGARKFIGFEPEGAIPSQDYADQRFYICRDVPPERLNLTPRCQSWDYASNGYYFVTICTHNRQHFLGDVVKDKMQLSAVGEIVAEEWQKTAQLRSYIELDEWIVMPNHLHGIIIINNQPLQPVIDTFQRNLSTRMVKSRLKTKSLGSIIGQIKSVCTKRIWEAGFDDFDWQDRFYDHIIQNEESLYNIREYIINNPVKWELDKNNLANLYM
jgi:REP element-mobilizing transposase RayT